MIWDCVSALKYINVLRQVSTSTCEIGVKLREVARRVVADAAAPQR